METLVHQILTPIVADYRPKKQAKAKTPILLKVIRVLFNTVGRVMPMLAARQALRLFGTPRTRYQGNNARKIRERAETFLVESEGQAIHGYLWNNQGPTVLLVHGWETGGLHLASFVEPLWALGFRIVALDGPAHGKSEGKSTNLPHYAAAIAAVIRKIGPVHHLIAHSFGGAASVYLASHQPEEFPFEKMVLINVPNKLERIIGDFARMVHLPASVELGMHRLIRKRFGVDPRAMEISSLGKLMRVKEILLVHDLEDDVVPFYNALEVAHALDNACILECRNLGHNRILKNPQVTTRVAQFLKDDLIF